MELVSNDSVEKRYFLLKLFMIFYLHNFERLTFGDICFILEEDKDIVITYYEMSYINVKKSIE